VTLPNFVVIGAGRCGTTSLHRLLGQHPDVFMCPTKSPNHFAAHLAQPPWENPAAVAMARHWVADPLRYESLFDAATTQCAIGEVSPVYLQAVDAARALHERCPGAKLVAILRDPAERAYAHFIGRRRDGIEPVATFEEKVGTELADPLPDDVAFGHYIGCGRYHHFLSPYLERFAPEQMLIVLYDDLAADPATVLRQVFGFLGVDSSFEPTPVERLNRSGEIRGRLRRTVWTSTVRARTALRPYLPARLRTAIGRPFVADVHKPPLDPMLRARIVAALDADLAALEQYLGRELSAWRRH